MAPEARGTTIREEAGSVGVKAVAAKDNIIAIRIKSSRYSSAQLEQRLRRGHACTPVIARVEDDRVILDFRTVFAEQESALAESLATALR